ARDRGARREDRRRRRCGARSLPRCTRAVGDRVVEPRALARATARARACTLHSARSQRAAGRSDALARDGARVARPARTRRHPGAEVKRTKPKSDGTLLPEVRAPKLDDNRRTFGVDEAGRGPIIGPMAIAVVALDKRGAAALRRAGVADSKSFGFGADACAK